MFKGDVVEKIFVVPKQPGMILRDPITKRILPDEGAFVKKNSFWLKRIVSGEVKLVDKEETSDKGDEK